MSAPFVPNRWALVHKDHLQHHGSCLEFKLRQLKFINLISSGNTREALAYAKVLGQFAPRHTKGWYHLHVAIHTNIYCSHEANVSALLQLNVVQISCSLQPNVSLSVLISLVVHV